MKKTYLIILALIILLPFATDANSETGISKDREELKRDFDIVAQNFGALEFSYYTFTLEFERTPADISELKSTGHLRCELINPYSDGEVFLGAIGDKPVPGGLYYSKDGDQWGVFECFYVNPNNPEVLRSLLTRIKLFTHKELHKVVFNPKLSRPEQLTIVYLLQLDDAIMSFEQKFGRMPDSIEEMRERGDVNVNYRNPFTNEQVKHSETLSPGDYMYNKIVVPGVNRIRKKDENGQITFVEVEANEEYYEIVGWGEEAPIYYYSTDESRDSYKWNGNSTNPNLNDLG